MRRVFGFFGYYIGFMILFGAVVFILAYGALELHEAEKRKYEQAIGRRVVFNDDTTTVVDYSLLTETYTLSNGLVVSRRYIDKNQ